MEHLKVCRKKSGLNLDEAAAYLEISRNALSMYESGKLSAPVTVIIKMLRVYKTNVKSLLGVNAPERPLTEGDKLYDEIHRNIFLRIEEMEHTRMRAGMNKYSVKETEDLYTVLFNDISEKIVDENLKAEVIRLQNSSVT